MGPILSMVQLRPMAPNRLTLPYVGLRPATPQVAEGDTIDPRVSVPIENPTSPADVAEAGPAEDPLELSSILQGFRVLPPNHNPPWASAPMDSLAIRTAPASRSRSTTA